MNIARTARTYRVSRNTMYKMVATLKHKETPEERFGKGECITMNELCDMYHVTRETMRIRLMLIRSHYIKYAAGTKRYTPKQVEIIIEKLKEKGFDPVLKAQQP